jgi:hypothetical protein
MNHDLHRFGAFCFILVGCTTLHPAPERTLPPVSPPSRVHAKAKPAPFLVEAFRCSLEVSPNLNAGIRVYSSLDGKETNVIYGPDRMDSRPIANDSILYNGVKTVLANTSDGQTLYSFQQAKFTLQIKVPPARSANGVLEASYSDHAGASGIKGFCARVSPVVY